MPIRVARFVSALRHARVRPTFVDRALVVRTAVLLACGILLAACGADDDAGLSSKGKGGAGASGPGGVAGAAASGKGGTAGVPAAETGGAGGAAGKGSKGGAGGASTAGGGGAESAQAGQGGGDGEPAAGAGGVGSTSGTGGTGTGGSVASGGTAGAAGQGDAGAGGGVACEGTWTAIPGASPTVFAYANDTLFTLTFNGLSPNIAFIAPGDPAWTVVPTSPPLYDDKPIADVAPAFEPWSLSVVGDDLVYVYAVRYGQSRSYRAAVIDRLTGNAVKLAEPVNVNHFPSVGATGTKVVAFGGWAGGFEQGGSCYSFPLTDVVDPATVTHQGGGASPLVGRERALVARAGEQVLFFGGQQRLKGAGCMTPNPVIDHLADGALFDPATNTWGPRLEVEGEEATAVVSLGARAAVLTVSSICDVGPGEAALSCFKPGVAGYGVLGGHAAPIVHFGTDGGFVSANLLYQVSYVTDPAAKTVKPLCKLPTQLESKYDPMPASRFAAGAGTKGVVWGSQGGFFFSR